MNHTIEIFFLGTGAAIPSLRRNLPTLAISFESELILCDCCEGTQQNLLKLHLSASKIHHIFLSHLHGDHIFGLPGLLTSQQLLGRTNEMHLWGPPGIHSYIHAIEQVTGYKIRFPVLIHEFNEPEPEPIHLPFVSCTARLLQHSIPCYGFRFEEAARPGKFDERKARQLNIPNNALRGELIKGNPITLENGRIIFPDEVVGPPPQRKIVTYCTDTRPCEASLSLARNADVLFHDSTFMHTLHPRALETNHSTSVEAAQIAKQANVGRLFLWHISGRHEEADEAIMLEEARAIFDQSHIAEDLSSWCIE